MNKISYRRHRFPAAIIQHAVWVYLRFTLSDRDVEDLLAERGIDVSHEIVRRWSWKFGQAYSRRLRKARPRPDGRWHLDEAFISIIGKQMYLWRAVDSEGEALKLLRKLLKRQGFLPSAIVTDRLKSYGAALGEIGLTRKHQMGDRLNNRAENSHQPARRRERRMQRFKSPGSAQRFLSIHAAIYNQFNVQCNLISRKILRKFRADAMGQWRIAAAAA